MYRRPYRPPPQSDVAPPADSLLPVPVISRHPLPLSGWAAIARFVAVVFLVTTVAVTVARAAGQYWPGVGGLLAATGVALAIAAGVKLLWVGRTVRVPVLSGAAVLVAVGSGLSVLAAGGLLVNLPGGMVLIVALLAVPAAWWADGVTSTLDAKWTAALGGGLLLLAGLAALPIPSAAYGWLCCLTLLANEAVSLAVLFTYVGYVLADPALPRDTVQEADAQWKRILVGREWGSITPFAQTGVIALLALFLAALVVSAAGAPPEPPAQQAVAPQPLGAGGAELLACNTVLVVTAALVFAAFVWALRRPIGRALAVWTLYPDAPLPGVYRPAGWLGSVGLRRIALAGVVLLNAALVRATLSAFDGRLAALALGGKPPTDAPDEPTAQLAQFSLCYAFAFLTPLLFPVGLFVGHCLSLSPLHARLEAADPAHPHTAPEGSP